MLCQIGFDADVGNAQSQTNQVGFERESVIELVPSRCLCCRLLRLGWLVERTREVELRLLYLADAIDYQQEGIVYRYSATGKCLVSFYVGVIPTEFCWSK